MDATKESREVIRGAGSGPIRQLDVIAEVSPYVVCDVQNLLKHPYAEPKEPTKRGANVIVLTPKTDNPIAPITFDKENPQPTTEPQEAVEVRSGHHHHRHVVIYWVR